MNQGEVLMGGTPGEVRADRRVQEVYTGTGTPPVSSRAAGASGDRAPLLRFERVNTFYGKSHILTDATLDVREGEIVALLGRNGAGKSTLLKTLAGLVPPASGAIEYDGRSIAGMPAPDIARLGIGYVPQGPGTLRGHDRGGEPRAGAPRARHGRRERRRVERREDLRDISRASRSAGTSRRTTFRAASSRWRRWRALYRAT